MELGTCRPRPARYAANMPMSRGPPTAAPGPPKRLFLGFLGDVGDLAKLVQGKAGVRPREDLDEALAHELADCLWCVVTLADAYDVDLATAFVSTMDQLSEHLSQP